MSHGAYESDARWVPDEITADEVTPPPEPLVARHPVFAGVPYACVDRLLLAGVMTTYEPGEHIAREGDVADQYCLLAKGSVRAYFTSRDGLEMTSRLYGAPAAWGEIELLHDQRCMESCVAVDRARVFKVPKGEFLELIHAYPALMMNVLRDASARLLLSTQHERATALLSVRERVMDLMLSYVRLYGVPTEGGTMIRIPLSQGDIAQGLGIALKSVSRVFGELSAAGVLERKGARYIVRNVAALQAPGQSHGVDWIAGRSL
jgi:CRP-like cAMP-binding protein